MKTRVVHVNGHDYIYARDSVYIAHGKSETVERSLGPARSGIDLSAKKIAFYEYLKKQEIKQRVAFWNNKIQDPAFRDYISFEKLEILRSDLYRAKKDMGPVASNLMETGFVVDFIYNSNRLEGSQVPRIRIEQEVKQKKKTVGEVANSLKALAIINEKFDFSISKIVNLHSVLMAHEPEKIGLRKGPVVVGQSEVCPWQNIKRELSSLCKWYKQNKTSMYPPELAFDFYYKFERIHPFEDGNGRTGRLLMNRILRENKYHPIIISWKRKQAQEAAFEKRMEGRAQNFFNFMKEEFTKTHRIFIKKIDSALNAERLSKVFLEPSREYE